MGTAWPAAGPRTSATWEMRNTRSGEIRAPAPATVGPGPGRVLRGQPGPRHVHDRPGTAGDRGSAPFPVPGLAAAAGDRPRALVRQPLRPAAHGPPAVLAHDDLDRRG